MMADRKYIVIKLDGSADEFGNQKEVEALISFPAFMVHKVVAETFRRYGRLDDYSAKDLWHVYAEGEVVSAGFINSNNECYGGSESLDVKSRGLDDTQLLCTERVYEPTVIRSAERTPVDSLELLSTLIAEVNLKLTAPQAKFLRSLRRQEERKLRFNK